MNWFDYPIDTNALIRKKKEIKEGLKGNPDLIKKRVAVLGGSTTNEVVDQLELFLLHHGFDVEFYQSDYGHYWQNAVFGSRTLDSFSPDIIYIHTNWRNIENFPDLDDSEDEVTAKLNAEMDRFQIMWENLEKKFHCPIIQNNFDRPDYRLMGNRDIWDFRGRSHYISRLNQIMYTYAQNHDDFYVNDLEYISQDYGLSKWNQSIYWYMYKYAMCMDAVPYVAQSVANIVKSIYGKNKKVLALDLDHTLWGGIVGDDGVEGIRIGQEDPKGQAYSAFQGYCKALQKTGVVLAVNSKNEMENALAGLNHPESILRPEDFVAIRANWNPKDQNIKEIADELSLGTDSFVFADDNPAEREIVSVQLPEVSVPMMDRVENYIKVLDHCGYFEVTAISAEDQHKTELYHAKARASQAVASFADYGEYLDSLKMTAVIDDFKPLYIQRIAQLTNKSNQFNLTTLRCSEDDIKRMQEDDAYICLCGRLTDKFGDNGIVAVTAGEIIGDTLHIRLWIMSCRVLKRGMEDVMMNALVGVASSRKIDKIAGHYYPTRKNAMVKDFYGTMGFAKISEDKDGSGEWVLNREEYDEKISHMVVDNQF